MDLQDNLVFQVLRDNKFLLYIIIFLILLFLFLFLRVLPKSPPYHIKKGQCITLKYKNYFASEPINIDKGATLIIEKGVKINFGYNSYIKVEGNLVIEGDNKHKVRLYSDISQQSWKGLFIEKGAKLYMKSVVIRDIKAQQVIKLDTAKVEIYDSYFKYNKGVKSSVIFAKNSDILIKNTLFYKNSFIKTKNSLLGNSILVLINCNTNIISSIFSNNKGYSSGSIYVKKGNLKLNNVLFKSNYSKSNGGAITIKDVVKKVEIENTIFNLNKAKRFGGDIYIDNVYSLDILNSKFIDSKSRDGSAIYIDNIYNLNLISNIFKGNKSLLTGVLFIKDVLDKVLVEDCKFTSNITSNAGIMYLENVNIKINKVKFFLNKSKSGVCIFSKHSMIKINDLNAKDNIAVGRGGCFYLLNNSDININNSYFKSNKSMQGGVIYSKNSKIVVLNSKFLLNKALKDGIFSIVGSELYIDNCKFIKNLVYSKYSILSAYKESRVFIQNSVFNKNKSKIKSFMFFKDELSKIENKNNKIEIGN